MDPASPAVALRFVVKRHSPRCAAHRQSMDFSDASGSGQYPTVNRWRRWCFVLAGLVVFFWYPLVAKLDHPVQWLDAVGLAFFAVAGTGKALAYGLNPVMAALLGMLTGIGGGMLRDVLANDIPAVLRADLYALAALACAVIVAAGHALRFPPLAPAIVGMVVCFALRFMAIRYGWHLPAVRMPQGRTDNAHTTDDQNPTDHS